MSWRHPRPLAAEGRDEGRGARGGLSAHGIQGEPARHRRTQAAPELAAPVRRARRAPVRLRGPRRAASASGRAGPGVGLRAGWPRTNPLNARTAARRSSPGSGITGRCASGTAAGRPSPWSAPAWWEMGLLEPADWKASWIEPDLPEDVVEAGTAPMLRREFKVSGAVERARALRDEPRALRAAPERPARRRRALHARDGRATTSACSTRPTT